METFIDPTDRLTRPQAAELIGVSPTTLANAACLGLDYPPYTLVGRRAFYSRKSIMDWLRRRTGTSAAAIREQLAGVGD